MKTGPDEILVAWIENEGQRPICDVPWMGMAIVQADGNVNFCCFSNGIVGNVYQSNFEEIWNSREMQLIRRELSEQRLPEVCRSSNCPVFRGDRQHYVIGRMEGQHVPFRRSGAEGPRMAIRENLRGSGLRMSGNCLRMGEPLKLDLVVKSLTPALATHYYEQLVKHLKLDLIVESLPPLTADLFVCLRSPSGAVRFLPSGEDYAVPFEISLSLTGSSEFILVPLWDGPIEGLTIGDYEICAALFETESNPNSLLNCLWATSMDLRISPPGLIRSIWRRLLAAG